MIRFDAVSFAFGALSLLEGFSLEVPAGTVTAVVGASGSGKSTLLRLAAGLLRPRHGRVSCPEGRALVFQDPRLLPWMTVVENVQFALKAGGVPRGEWAERTGPLLARVGLSRVAHLRPRELSGGMAQRAALVRGLALRPAALLLDEPFSAVDPILREDLQDGLQDLLSERAPTTLLVTHDLAEALLLADRVIVLRERPVRIVAALSVDRPRERGSEYLVGLTRELRRALVG